MLEDLQMELVSVKEELFKLQVKVDAGRVSDFLTSNEVMEWLKISRPTLHRWKERGVLVSYNIGGKILFKKSEILAMVEKGRY